MRRGLLLLATLAVLSLPAFAQGGSCNSIPVPSGVTSCLYASSGSGSDSNSGTTEASPWAHFKGMQGCTGNCNSFSPAPGEAFVLKIGDTWTATGSSTYWNFPASGTSANPIVIGGLDPTWGSATNARPIFTGAGTWPGTISTATSMLNLQGLSYVEASWMEMTGLFYNSPGGSELAYIALSGGSNLTVDHNYLHGWSHSSGAAENANANAIVAVGGGSGDRVAYNYITGIDVIPAGAYGFGAVYVGGGVNEIDHNYFSYVSDVINESGVNTIHDNTFGPGSGIPPYAGAGTHNNTAEENAGSAIGLTMYNNYFDLSLSTGGIVVQLAPNASKTSYFFNNVQVNGPTNQANQVVCADSLSGGGGTCTVFNNTLEAGPDSGPPSGKPLRAGNFNGHTAPSEINLYNNHTVSSSSPMYTTSDCTSGCAVTQSPNPNLIQSKTTANTQGYSLSQSPYQFYPTTGGSTIGAGTNESAVCTTISGINAAAGTACLADTTYGVTINSTTHTITGSARTPNNRPSSGAWDAGAYEFTSGGGSPTFTAAPSTIPAHHSGNISLTLTGVGTSWTGSTAFSLSGVTGVTLVGNSNTSATSETLTVTTGSGTGTLTITDTTDAISSTISVATASLAINPTSGATGTTPTVTLTGSNTLWLSETPSTLFGVSGGTGASLGALTVNSNTAATATLTVGSSAGTLTVTDNSTTATTAFTATAPSSFTLTVVVAGPGRVSSSPSGISSCTSSSGICSAAFSSGTNVTLTPTANGGYYLGAWQGGCTGLAGCAVTLSANSTVTATFLLTYVASTSPLLVALPPTPNMGNLLNNNATWYDTSYPSGTAAPGVRCTDTATAGSSSNPNKPLSAGIGGSGDGMPLFNANSTLLHINTNGGANYILPFNPSTLVCGKAISTSQNTAGGGSPNVSVDFGQGYFDWVSPNLYYGIQGSTVTQYSIIPATGAYTAIGPVADFQYALPSGSLVSPWAATTAYTSGQYVTAALSFPDWISNHAYSTLGTVITPLTNNPLGCAFKLVTTGTSAVSERTWSTSGACVAASNTTLTDGTAVWRNLGGPPTFVFQLTSASGSSGGTTPTWIPAGTGRPDLMTTVADGALTWTNVGPEVPPSYRDVAGNSYDPTNVNTRFCQDTSTNSYGYNNNYTNYQGGQGSGIWSVCYNAATTSYVTLNTATGWQSTTACTGPQACTAMTPVGAYTNITTGGCGYFIHNVKGSYSNDYVAVAQQALLAGATGCLVGTVNNWSPFLPFNAASEAPYLGALNHWAQGNRLMVNVGQNAQTFGFSTGVYSIIYPSANPQTLADITTSWQPTPCDSTGYSPGYIYVNPPCTSANGYDSHMSRAYNPGGTDVAPVCGSIYNVHTLSPLPFAPFQGEAICIPTNLTWTSTPAGQNAPYRFTHEWASGANPFFDAQFAISQLSGDGKFLAFTSDWWNQSTQTCSFGDVSGNPTSICGTPWVQGAAYALNAMVNPFSSTGGSGTNYGVYKVTTAGTASITTPAWFVCNSGTAGNTVTDANGVVYTCQGTATARSDVMIVALTGPGVTVPPTAPTILGVFASLIDAATTLLEGGQ